MSNTILPLWEHNPAANGEFEPYIELFLLDSATPKGCVLVLPGGGYEMRSEEEGNPVAEKFNELGFHAAVLQYRVAPRRWPEPQMDVLRAVQILRRLAGVTTMKEDKIAVAGFSAGGHLAACAGTLADSIEVVANDEADNLPARPDAMILCYPVINSGEYAHNGSFEQLLGTAESTPVREYLSLENRVDDKTPPTFLWHTWNDPLVPVENSWRFANALRKQNITTETHFFFEGHHGIGLAKGYSAERWLELAADFLRRQGF